MPVERSSEWTTEFDGSLAGLQGAVAELRSAGAPGTCDVTLRQGAPAHLTATYYYSEDTDEVDEDIPVEPQAVTQ